MAAPLPAPGVVDGFWGAVGNTPLIRLRRASDATGCEILGKAEFMNPGGSVKDRAALGILRAAMASGALVRGQPGTVVEGTAGNTGIGIALAASAMGWKSVIVVPETQAREKLDYLRMIGMNADDPHQVEDVMARELKKIKEEELHASHALQNIADALPALGIVAAVLGVIKTMASIDQPPAVLGKMIGGALVGTFLGVLLAYGLVGPFAARLKGVVEEEAKYLEVVRAVMVAHLHGNAPQVAVETGRKMVPSHHMPTFQELEEAIQALTI